MSAMSAPPMDDARADEDPTEIPAIAPDRNALCPTGETAERRFSRLYAEYFERTAGFVRGIYGFDRETAEDVAQTVFLNVWRTIVKIDPERERTWIYKLAARSGADVLRQRKRRGGPLTFSDLQPAGPNGRRAHPSPSDGRMDLIGVAEREGRPVGGRAAAYADPVERVLQSEALAEALAHCRSERARNVVLLRMAGFKTREIAAALGMREPTVISDLSRHRQDNAELAAAM